MHSSRMRTARFSCHLWGVVFALWEGRGVCPPSLDADAPPVERQTPVKILPFPRLHLRAANIYIFHYIVQINLPVPYNNILWCRQNCRYCRTLYCTVEPSPPNGQTRTIPTVSGSMYLRIPKEYPFARDYTDRTPLESSQKVISMGNSSIRNTCGHFPVT